MNRKILLLVLFFLLSNFLFGCFGISYDISTTFFNMTMGFDKIQDDYVKVTFVSENISEEEQQETRRSDIFIGEGRNISEAFLASFAYSKEVRLGHTEFILIGEEAAKDNINKYFDFLSRDYETRLTERVFVTKGMEAEEFITKIDSNAASVSDRLSGLSDMAVVLSYSSNKITLAEIINMVDSEYSYAYIPCLDITKKSISQDEEIWNPVLNGYAIVKNSKLIGYLTENMSRGLNWILKKIEQCFFIVKDNQDKMITLEMLQYTTSVDPIIKNGNLEVTIEINIESNIIEQEGTEDIYNDKTLRYIESQQSEIVKKEVESAIEYAQKNGVDFIGIGDAFYHKYPVKWDKYKEDWEKKFKNLNIKVFVNSKINRSYVIKEPIGSKEK